MAAHRFVIEGHPNGNGTATMWYINDQGQQFPVKHFTKEDQEDDSEFERAAAEAALQYTRRFLSEQ